MCSQYQALPLSPTESLGMRLTHLFLICLGSVNRVVTIKIEGNVTGLSSSIVVVMDVPLHQPLYYVSKLEEIVAW